jgi:hypothetical protein
VVILSKAGARTQAAIFALTGMALVLAWQWATVTSNYRGNWSALFCTGAVRGAPASLATEHIYQFKGSAGYDGQAYHYIAHDPFLRDAELKSFVDEPRLRYRRILVPGLAWLMALGQSDRVDRAYFLVFLAMAGLGIYWSCALCHRFGRPAWWGLTFLLLPAVIVGIDRMVIDVALAAFTVGFALHWERPSGLFWLILASAALTRETGLFLAAAYGFYLLLHRQWVPALRYWLSLAPMALWYLYVYLHTSGFDYGANFMPFSGILRAMLHSAAYPARVPLVPLLRGADLLALGGAVFAFGQAGYLTMGLRCFDPECLAVLCYAVTLALSQRTDHWGHVFDYGRVYTPLLILLAVQGLRSRQVGWLLPWLMVVPRVGMQFAPQLLGVAQALFQG